MSKWIRYSLVALALTACRQEHHPTCCAKYVAPHFDSVTFVVVGDTPYNAADETMLQKAVPAIRDGDYPFVIHVGDYKGGRSECLTMHDERHAQLFAELDPTPLFYTPGDNEWTDCDRNEDTKTGKPYSDLDRLETVRSLFFTEKPFVPESYNTEQQIIGAVRENLRWDYAGLQFMTLHVTGTNNGRDWVTGDPLERALDEVTARDAANMAWLKETFAKAKADNANALILAMQADPNDIADKPEDVMCQTVAETSDHACDAFTDLRVAIRDEAVAFGKPVLLIHGDTAPFTLRQDFSGEDAENLWLLNAAGDTGPGYGTRDVTEVTITPDAEMPFAAKGLLTGKTPKTSKK